MLEREDLVPLAYLNKFAVVTGIDTSTWRNRASLRVRFSESRNASNRRPRMLAFPGAAPMRSARLGDDLLSGQRIANRPIRRGGHELRILRQRPGRVTRNRLSPGGSPLFEFTI